MHLVRSVGWSLACLAVFFLLLFLIRGWRGQQIGSMSIRVVNNTTRAVKVMPCWNFACTDVVGMRTTVLRPGEAKQVTGAWPNDVPQGVVIGVQSPSAQPMHFDGCIVSYFNSGTKVGVARVSSELPCPSSGGPPAGG